ncbi:MAG: sigma-70 family RNA polymerase sigma factor [Capsulimonadales bacterium]|nr:sigma-70 family RNA polymerase sigma factor [Capsulimonadales bacterium]
MKPTTDAYEARLVARFRQGDARALETLFDRYVDRALGLAVRLTETREDAEEVTQEAFLRVFRQARQFRGDAPTFGPWLFAIVRNLAADKRRQLRLPTLSLSSLELSSAPADRSAEEEWQRHAERSALLNALDTLPEEWKVVLTLCDLEEVTHAEAAAALGKSVAATKSLLYRARRALRDRLRAYYEEAHDL